jgi:hypothetical protein
MKLLRISRNGMELASVSLRQPVSTLGRSPTCDGVLRAPGVRPMHFLFESQGPESNRWVLFDISNDSGEGIVVGDGRVEFKGFYFEVSEGALDPADQIGGGIQRSVHQIENIAAGGGRLVESVRIRRDSGAVQEVSHLVVPASIFSRNRRMRPFEDIASIDLVLDRGAVRVELKGGKDAPGRVRHQRNSEPGELLPGNSLELGTSDWVRLELGEDDLYFRWVARVPKVPIPREVIGNPVLRLGSLVGFLIAVGAAGWIAWRVKNPREPIIQQPPRIATVEVKEAPPPPPPPPEEIPKAAPPPKAKTEVAAQQKALSSAPKFAKPAPPKAETKPGLNAPAPPSDVNTLGLLGALKPSAPKEGAGVRADQIFDDSVVSQAVTGNSGSIALKTPPSGALDLGKTGGAQKSKGDGLQALTTTMSKGADYAPKNVGPVVTSGTGGKALGSGLEGIGAMGGTGAAGAEDGSGTEVKGGLDRETVRRVIKSNRGKVQACYERALMAAPKLAGRVVTQFDISPKGVVLTAGVRNSDVQSKTLESCLVEVVKQMVFPEAPSGVGTRVIYPFVFQARNN